jgi:hypothetical protein
MSRSQLMPRRPCASYGRKRSVKFVEYISSLSDLTYTEWCRYAKRLIKVCTCIADFHPYSFVADFDHPFLHALYSLLIFFLFLLVFFEKGITGDSNFSFLVATPTGAGGGTSFLYSQDGVVFRGARHVPSTSRHPGVRHVKSL